MLQIPITFKLRPLKFLNRDIIGAMIGENRQLVTDEPVEFVK